LSDPKPRPLTPTKGLTLCIFGVAGAGKTRLIGTGPKTLVIRPPTDHTESIVLPAEVEEVVVDDWNDMFEVHQWLQQGAHREYEWVWLDSISLWQDHGLDDVLAAAIARKGGPESPRAEFGPDKGEYGINMGRIGKWTRDMHALADAGQINFGITAHAAEVYDPTSEEDVWAPWIQGKNMIWKISGYMHVVAYLKVVQKKGKDPRRKLATSAPGFYGKDQISDDGLNDLWDPTMPKIIEVLDGARRKKSPRRKRAVRKRRQ
jgi:hypothetical protein